MPRPIPSTRSQFDKVAIVVANEPEASALAGIEVTDPASAVSGGAQIAGTGRRDGDHHAGEAGSVVASSDAGKAHPRLCPSSRGIPPPPVTPIAVCLVVALAEGKSLSEAVRFASACRRTVRATVRRSAVDPWRAEIDAFLRGEKSI